MYRMKRSAEKNSSPETHCQFLVLASRQVKIIRWYRGELLELLCMLLILEKAFLNYSLDPYL